jgi:hypothetical protein
MKPTFIPTPRHTKPASRLDSQNNVISLQGSKGKTILGAETDQADTTNQEELQTLTQDCQSTTSYRSNEIVNILCTCRQHIGSCMYTVIFSLNISVLNLKST